MGSCQIDLEHRYLKNRLRVTRKMTHMASTLPQLTSLVVCGVGLLVLGQDLAEIPQDLSFSCEGRAYGYYAAPSTNCQVFTSVWETGTSNGHSSAPIRQFSTSNTLSVTIRLTSTVWRPKSFMPSTTTSG